MAAACALEILGNVCSKQSGKSFGGICSGDACVTDLRVAGSADEPQGLGKRHGDHQQGGGFNKRPYGGPGQQTGEKPFAMKVSDCEAA
jgi:hypothetical protein